MSQKQLQFHLQQNQKRRHTEKYCLDSPTDNSLPDNYQQQSQCSRLTSLNAVASSPTKSLIPADVITTNHHNHSSSNHFATTLRTGCCEHTSPAHHCSSTSKNYQLYNQSNSKNYPECATLKCQYCTHVNHNEPSVS